MLRLFVCVVFFYWKEIEIAKKHECDDLGNPMPYKMMFVQPPRSKTVGEDAFLVAKVEFFRRREKHIGT